MEIYNEDCLGSNGLCKLLDKSVDMVLCDLPYGQTGNVWDTKLDLNALFKEYDRIIKDNGAIVLFAMQPFTTDLINAYRKHFKYSLVWDKNIGSNFLSCKKRPMRSHEDILVFYKKQPTYNPQMEEGKPYIKRPDDKRLISHYGKAYPIHTDHGLTGKRYPKSVLRFAKDQGLHTTQKPLKLCEWLIRTYTNEGEVVMDNTMGSGTTGVACVNTNRKFIGYELDNKYFEISKERIEKLKCV